MLDIRRIRSEPDAVKASLARRGIDTADIDTVAALDERQRRLGSQRDELRVQIKAISKQVGLLHKEGKREAAADAQAESRLLGEKEAALATEAAAVAAEVRDLLLRIPNTPHDDAPNGAGEAENPVVRVVGFDPDGYGEHQRIPHWELGPRYGILDNERAVKISGAMFTMQRKGGATLARGLLQYALDRNADEFEEVRPPTLVTSDTLTATGQLPKFADDAYWVERDDLWCIPTAEVPLTSIHRDEILDTAELPMRFMAATSCFRREAGSAGRDTRGMLRTHEFDKVEIFQYATPEQAPAELEAMVARAEAGIRDLGLAYRVIEICTGDMGQSHHRSFDIEVYAPGTDQWLEVSSVSWFSDYQSRRGNIRYRPGGGGTAMVHTLNGSALAVPRVWAAIVETYHRADGGIDVPEALLPYFRGSDRIA
ncbi:serine--tRNA ligase [Aquihabitans sp. McL0605]|uniref:serine--tRNA ligase n=1 Tax=Aquihabitans sp. McL0605 TaxID=3415671 RepID=UPI003CFAA2A7